ncbi:unnamed protein product [Clavelina lepadiformis]|uniref:Fucosyltransferase n=1 Tax=Clavelina lepadiformis TaxID=159417 RepID=A0ABP0G2K2_CLALP
MSKSKVRLWQATLMLFMVLFLFYFSLYTKLMVKNRQSLDKKNGNWRATIMKLMETISPPTPLTSPSATTAVYDETTKTAANKDQSSPRKPKILLWKSTPHVQGWTLPSSEMCGFGCEITRNRSEIESSDAVIFYMITADFNDLPDPRKRQWDQAFVWWCHESPATVNNFWHQSLREYNGYFNWTMHYRKDSNITAAFIPHTARDWYFDRVGRKTEKLIKKLKRTTSKTKFEEMFQELMKVKRNSAAWVVSDCNFVKGATTRRRFVSSMKHLGNYSVDIFGSCGNKHLAKKSSAMYDVLRTYKFYLAFENTQFCREYLTEKFWYNSLYAGVVPIVWGPSKATVQDLAPPNSFIHVEDFNYNVTKLTNFLKYLEGNDEAYKNYFKWWMMPGFYPIYKLREAEDPEDRVGESIFQFEVNGFCHLCKMLHEKRHKTTHWAVSDPHQAFYGPEDLRCLY